MLKCFPTGRSNIVGDFKTFAINLGMRFLHLFIETLRGRKKKKKLKKKETRSKEIQDLLFIAIFLIERTIINFCDHLIAP